MFGTSKILKSHFSKIFDAKCFSIAKFPIIKKSLPLAMF
jgi:hypothetical protein